MKKPTVRVRQENGVFRFDAKCPLQLTDGYVYITMIRYPDGSDNYTLTLAARSSNLALREYRAQFGKDPE